MKENTYRLILFLVLIAVVIFTGYRYKHRMTERSETRQEIVTIDDEEVETDQEDPVHLNKERIVNLQNKGEDNINLPDTELKLEFPEYEEHRKSLSWMSEEDYQHLQEQLTGYLEKKGMTNVTRVHLHQDSIQRVNAFERLLYLDVDYRTEASDTLLIKARCDTYKGTMRFAFEVQYGD